MREKILLTICNSLNISHESLIEAERPNDLYFTTNISVASIANLNNEIIQKLIEQYGDSLKVEVGIEDLEPDLTINSSTDIGIIQTQISQILERNNPEDKLLFTLEIDKNKLIMKLGASLDIDTVHYFLYYSNLFSYLDLPVFRLDEELFKNWDFPTALIVGEVEIELIGHLFSIVGETQLDSLNKTPITAKHKRRLESLYTLASDVNKWVGFQLSSITPFHFLFEKKVVPKEAEGLEGLLKRHLIATFAIYTANRTMQSDNLLELTYASAEQVTDIRFEGNFNYENDLDEIITRVLLWLSGLNSRDKLRYLQAVIARDSSEHESLFSLSSNLATYFKDADWHYKLSIDDKITKHFDSYRVVASHVAGVMKEISSAIETVTKGLNDSLLSAIGVVILGLIAALTGGKTPTFVFSLLMVAYAVGYLYLFQLGYRMLGIIQNYDMILADSKEQIAEYNRRLGKERVKQLTKNLQRRKNHFIAWLWTTTVIYIVVAIIIIILGIWGAPLFSSLGVLTVITSTPTTTPTPTDLPTVIPTQIPLTAPPSPISP